MARGFWTGLLHGGIVGVLAVAALSLAVPLPRDSGQKDPVGDAPLAPVPQAAPVGGQPAVAETSVGSVEPGYPPTPADASPDPVPARPAPDAPAAAAVDLPVGSEFGRGGDAVPVMPAPLAATRPDPVRPAVVVAPESEPAPVAAAPADRRPRPDAHNDGPVQLAPDMAEDLPQIEAAVAPSRPSAPVAPGRAAADAPDAAPALPADLLPARDRAPVAEPPSPAGAPAPDLSLPPDLSDLQGLSND